MLHIICKSKFVITLMCILSFCSATISVALGSEMDQLETNEIATDSFIIGANATYTDFNELIDHIEKKTIEKYAIYQYCYNGFYGFLGDAEKLNINIISGRIFSEEELRSSEPIIILNSTEAEFVQSKDGEEFYYYDGMRFKVIGIYEEMENPSLESTSAYYNYRSIEKRNSPNEYIKGTYIVLGDIDVNKVVDETTSLFDDVYHYTKFQDESHERTIVTLINYLLKVIYNEGELVRTSALLLTLMILLNISVLNNWIVIREKEIRVLYILGTSEQMVLKKLIGQYLIICTIPIVGSIGISAMIGLLKNGIGASSIALACGIASAIEIAFVLFSISIIIVSVKAIGLKI